MFSLKRWLWITDLSIIFVCFFSLFEQLFRSFPFFQFSFSLIFRSFRFCSLYFLNSIISFPFNIYCFPYFLTFNHFEFFELIYLFIYFWFYFYFRVVFLLIYLLFVCFCFCFLIYFSQLRVIRAFRSTLEDLEERRSVHSLHSLRSSRSHQLNPNLGYFNTSNQKNLSPLSAHQHYHPFFQRNQDNVNGLPATANLSEISFIDEDANNAQAESNYGKDKLTDKFNDDLPNPVHETRIWINIGELETLKWK